MGTILKDQNDLCGAIKAYKKAISIRPDYIDAHFNLANALKFQGKLNDAVAAYARVISINPNHAEAYNNMGVALKGQEKQTEAIDAKKALAINPDYGTARHLLSS